MPRIVSGNQKTNLCPNKEILNLFRPSVFYFSFYSRIQPYTQPYQFPIKNLVILRCITYVADVAF